VTTHTTDQLQGLRDERDSAEIAVDQLIAAWRDCPPCEASGVLKALREALDAYCRLTLELIQLESLHATH
jgi:hypothetical protein